MIKIYFIILALALITNTTGFRIARTVRRRRMHNKKINEEIKKCKDLSAIFRSDPNTCPVNTVDRYQNIYDNTNMKELWSYQEKTCFVYNRRSFGDILFSVIFTVLLVLYLMTTSLYPPF
jgi:hypothetical protein